jgi:diadenosine tetraphosphate (Ap4A) HIT family hydrolase
MNGYVPNGMVMFGEQCPQLHVHVTARDPSDPAWPGPCYDYKRPKPYPADALEPMIVTIRHALKSVDH